MTDFLLIGERLNTHRPSFAAQVANRDADAVIRELEKQIAAGATHVDLNAANGGLERETADIDWLLDVLLPALEANVGLVLDSPHPEIFARALQRIGRRPGTILNGITANTATHADVLRLAQTYGAGVIAILTDGSSAARSAEERLVMATQLHATLSDAGISEDRQFYDPQLLPAAFDTLQPAAALECVRQLRARWPRAHAVAGVSNVSFNMPNRALLNRAYLSMLIAAGADAVICDPCDGALAETLIASRALAGQDEFLATYIEKNAK